MRSITRLGLTGGIGSGKSTVGRMLSGHGAALVDADAIAREATATGGRAMPPIEQAFGAEFITPAGALDRDRMRALAFNDPTSRLLLESIVHPLVRQEIHRQEMAAVEHGARLIVFDVPLLVESSQWRPALDYVLVIDCAEHTQIDRVMARSALSRGDVEKIMQSQASRLTRLQAADLVICNDGLTLDGLGGLVREMSTRFGL